MPKQQGRKSASAFRTISEVARELDLPQHVLRFWETKFPSVHPLKRGGGRRYYRPEDIALLRRIRNLLHEDGYTIKGVQKILKQKGAARDATVPASMASPSPNTNSKPESFSGKKKELQELLAELLEIKEILSSSK